MSTDCPCCCLQVNSSISRSLLLHIQITSTFFHFVGMSMEYQSDAWLHLDADLKSVVDSPWWVFRLGFILMFLSSWGFLMGCFASLEKNGQKYLLHLLNRQNQRLILIIFNTLYFRLVCKKYRSKKRNPKREKTLHFYPSDLLNFFRQNKRKNPLFLHFVFSHYNAPLAYSLSFRW